MHGLECSCRFPRLEHAAASEIGKVNLTLGTVVVAEPESIAGPCLNLRETRHAPMIARTRSVLACAEHAIHAGG